MANNAVITQKQNKNIIMILVTSSDKLPIICIKMNKRIGLLSPKILKCVDLSSWDSNCENKVQHTILST